MEAHTNRKKVNNLIIIDQSGSMSIIRRSTLEGINETIKTCQALEEQYPEVEQYITMVTFNSGEYKVLCENAKAFDVAPLTIEQYIPGGGTPLYDAIGRAVSMTDAHVEKGDNVLVTVLTDGEENCSREFNLKMVKNLIEKRTADGWTFSLIGTDNLDVETMAQELSIENRFEFKQCDEDTDCMWATERKSRMIYTCAVAKSKELERGAYFKVTSKNSTQERNNK